MAESKITRIPTSIQCFRNIWTTSISFPTYVGQQGIVLSNADTMFMFWSAGGGELNIGKIYGDLRTITVTRSENTITITGTANRAYTVFTLI